MTRRLELVGRRFGRLVVMALAGCDSRGKSIWLCRCDCGKIGTHKAGDLKRGDTCSCGCLKLEGRHGAARTGKHTAEYDTWQHMIQRCTNPNATGHARYFDRGITVCPRWQGDHGFENFLSDMGLRPPGATLDRFPDNDGNYEPGNCRWATRKQQAQNRHPAVKGDVSGERNPNHRLRPSDVQRIRALAENTTHVEIAKQFGVTPGAVWKIVHRKTWVSQ